MTYEHLVLTLFSCRRNYPLFKLGNVEIYAQIANPLASNRLAARFRVFEMVCLPSVLSQSKQNFTWLIIIDKKLGPHSRKRLERLTRGKDRVILHEFDRAEDLKRLDWLEKYIRSDAELVLTTNLDDDDGLPVDYVSSLHSNIDQDIQSGTLPPLRIFGAKSTIVWDMVRAADAPYGRVSPWNRAVAVTSCGFSLLSERRNYPMSIFALDHYYAERYVDLSNPLRKETAEEKRGIFEAAYRKSILADDRRSFPIMFHDPCEHSGPVLVTNHGENAQQARMHETKPGHEPVTGPESFSRCTIDWSAALRYATYFPNEIRSRWLRRAYCSILRNRWRFLNNNNKYLFYR